MIKRYEKNIMATVCIPWNDDNSFDEKLFRKNIEILSHNDIKSLYLFGTAGEGYLPNSDMFLHIAKVFLNETQKYPLVLPMLGIISNSVTECIMRIEEAGKIGFTDFQISFPSWGVVTNSEAFTFLHMVCDRFPSARFMHYNNGLRSGKKLTAKQYSRLCSEIPNLVAIKQTGASLREVSELMFEDLPLQVFFLEDAYFYASMLGDCSLLISILNTNYRLAHRYFKAGVEQNKSELTILQKDINVFYDMLKILPSNKMDGAYDKLFVRYAIDDYPITLYPPYEGFTEEQWHSFDELLHKSLPHWLA